MSGSVLLRHQALTRGPWRPLHGGVLSLLTLPKQLALFHTSHENTAGFTQPYLRHR